MDGLMMGEVEVEDLDEGEDRGRVDRLENDSAARGEFVIGQFDHPFQILGRHVFDDLGGKNSAE